MSEWSSYRVRDFLLFSKDTLLEVYRGYNLDTWPWQILALVLVCFAAIVLIRPTALRVRILFTGLAAAWAHVALVFHLQYFEPINWASRYFAYAFILQAILLLLTGPLSLRFSLPTARGPIYKSGIVLFLISCLFPFEIIFGLDWSYVLIFGWGAERTACGTFLILLLLTRKARFMVLSLIPLLWMLLSGLVLGSLR